MRHALASLVFALFLFPSIAMGGTVKYEDLVITDGLYYKKFTDVPFTGKVTGNPQGSFKDGKKHGPWVSYHENGRLRSKGTLIDGKEIGPWVEYHKDGWLESNGTYENGKKDGPWVEYRKDGHVSKEVNFKQDKEDTSVEYSYGKNGQLEFKITYKGGKLSGLAVYYSNGQLRCRGPLTTQTTIRYIKKNVFWICRELDDLNLKQGAWVGYHKNGKLAYKGNYKDGEQDGPWVWYLKNGQLTGKGTYKDGKRHGPWVFYHENGEPDPSGVTSKTYDVHEGSGTYKNGWRVSD